MSKNINPVRTPSVKPVSVLTRSDYIHALVDLNPSAMAKVLNHHNVSLNWLSSPKLKDVELLKWCAKLLSNHHPRKYLNREIAKDLSSKLASVYAHVHMDIERNEEGVYTSCIEASAKYNSSDLYEDLDDRYKVVECPHCSKHENLDVYDYSLEDYNELQDFKRVGISPYYRCVECTTIFRPKLVDFDPLRHWDSQIQFTYEHMADWQHENVLEVLYNYCDQLNENGFDDIVIQGTNLNWRGASGTASVGKVDAQRLLELITVDSDYTLHVDHRTDMTLDVTLSHHDCPTGSGFICAPAYHCDVTEDVITLEQIEEAKALADVLEVLYPNSIFEKIHPDSWENVIEDYIELDEDLMEIVRLKGTDIDVEYANIIIAIQQKIDFV